MRFYRFEEWLSTLRWYHWLGGVVVFYAVAWVGHWLGYLPAESPGR